VTTRRTPTVSATRQQAESPSPPPFSETDALAASNTARQDLAPPAGEIAVPLLLDAKAVADPQAAAAAAVLECAYRDAQPPEAVRMLLAILRGSQMGPGEGWFGPAETRYSWCWLANRCGVDPGKHGIPRDKFPGSESWFARLDRNGDGAITADDLDWSDRNPCTQMSYMANRLFRKLNVQGNGRLTKQEMQQFFEKAARGTDHLSSDDFRDALLGGWSGGFLPGDAPSPAMLIRGLFAGELGSLNEGPRLGQPAPNFTLKTVDGKDAVQLGLLVGTKPVVLAFGNFTCGPFRSFYPDVEAVYRRCKDNANFLMVYVREAHPTDGWKMESNARVGVAVKQPTTFADRATVAGQFCNLLKPALRVVVDEMSDPVGNAYSGMPARLYVIDSQGNVAYKSGRGPFGFKTGEMEQALILHLLDQSSGGGRPQAHPSNG
jgi:Iodothyronine deiodinase